MLAKLSLAALCAAVCFIAPTGFVKADGAAAPAAQETQLIVDNHQKNVSVKDQNGKLLFAELIDTPNMLMQYRGSESSGLLDIEDGYGKVLWSHHIDSNTTISGDWSQQASGTLFTSLYTDKDKPGNDESGEFAAPDGTLTIGPDDQVAGADFHGSGTKFFYSQPKGQYFIEDSKMTVKMSLSPDNPSLDMTHNGVHIKMISGKHDGKDCLQLTVGKQTIFVMSGASLNIDPNGDIVLSPAAGGSLTQAATDTKSGSSQ